MKVPIPVIPAGGMLQRPNVQPGNSVGVHTGVSGNMRPPALQSTSPVAAGSAAPRKGAAGRSPQNGPGTLMHAGGFDNEPHFARSDGNTAVTHVSATMKAPNIRDNLLKHQQ